MKAHDIRAALSTVPLGPVRTAEENAAAFPKLTSFDSGAVYVGRFSGGDGPWERIPVAMSSFTFWKARLSSRPHD